MRATTEYVVQHYATTMNDEIVKATGLKLSSIYNIAYRHDLKKDRALIVQMARERTSDPNHGSLKTQFKKGQVAFNKGLKQTDYMSAEAIEKTKATQFQQGDNPWNTKEDGVVTLRHDGYLYIRSSLGVWDLYNRWLWRKHHGEIPEGHLVMFIDGNALNCVIENLHLQTQQQCITKNNIKQLPDEIKGAIYALNGFNRRVKTKIKNYGKE